MPRTSCGFSTGPASNYLLLEVVCLTDREGELTTRFFYAWHGHHKTTLLPHILKEILPNPVQVVSTKITLLNAHGNVWTV